MRRRQFLAGTAGVAAAATAGCGGDEGVTEWLTYAKATQKVIAEQWTEGVHDTDVASLVGRIVAEGAVNVTERNVPEAVAESDFLDRRVRYEDGVYEFERRKVSTEQVRDYRFTVRYADEDDGPGTATPGSNRSVAFDALPDVDRQALGAGFPVPDGTVESMRANGVTPGLPGDTDETYVKRFEATYRLSDVGPSELVDPLEDPVPLVAYNGTVYEVEVLPLGERTVVTYRYRVVERRDLGAVVERLADEHAVPSSAFTDAEREVLAEILESGTYPLTEDDDGPARSLLETLREHPEAEVAPREADPFATPTFGYPWRETDWLVRYRGEEYVVKYFEKTYD